MLVTVANFTEPYEAHLFRGRLEAEGIAAFVAHEWNVGLDWPMGLALGGVKVQVHRDLARDARAIERACIAGEYTRELNERFDQPDGICSHCGSANFRISCDLTHCAWAIVVGLLSAPFPMTGAMRKCRNCGTRWHRQLPE